MVSYLENGTSSYLVIVNRDFKNPMTLYIECENNVKKIIQRMDLRVPANAYQVKKDQR